MFICDSADCSILTREEITRAFKDALNRIKKFIDPKIGFGQDHKARVSWECPLLPHYMLLGLIYTS